MFPYDEILKVFKSKTWLYFLNEHPKISFNTVFQLNQARGLRVTGIKNLSPYICINSGYDVIIAS